MDKQMLRDLVNERLVEISRGFGPEAEDDQDYWIYSATIKVLDELAVVNNLLEGAQRFVDASVGVSQGLRVQMAYLRDQLEQVEKERNELRAKCTASYLDGEPWMK